jgi:ATP-dependent helicase/nuclease subunit A
VRGELTDSQREAIQRDAPDLCVTAGAGSGKTRVLVERFVRLVLHQGVKMERILAITFTEKAAAEMQGRIAEALEEAGREDLRREVEFSYISTIDAFCARILRENALEAEVDPRFTVLEEIESDRLLEEAADEALLARGEEETVGLLEATGIPDVTATLGRLYRQVRASGRRAEPRSLEPPPRPKAAMAEVRSAVEQVRNALEREDLTSMQRDTAGAQLGVAGEIEALAPSASAREIAAVFARLRRRISLQGVRNETFKAALIALRASLDGCLAEILEERARPVRKLLGELLQALDEAFEKKKRAAAALDFSDLAWKTRRLLQESPTVRRRIAGKFDQIFLDEFQDTNPLQKEILDLLHAASSFFAAGDAKQSIYGFRDAEVGIIAAFRREVEPKGGHISLPENFRSRPEIVAFSNRLFASGLWEPGEVGFESMVASAPHQAKSLPSVEILLAEGEKAEEGRQREADALAARIAALVEGGDLRFTRSDSDRRGEALGFGDVAILLRSTAGMRIYERALAARQIPYFVRKGRGFFQTQEVRDLTNLIRVLENPRDDYRLAAVLRSPLCGLTDSDLYRLCRRKNGSGRSLAERVRSQAGDLSGSGRFRLEAFLASLDRLRARKGRGPLWIDLDAMISGGSGEPETPGEGASWDRREGCLSRSILGPAALLHFDGKRRYANLRKLVDLVRGWEARGRTSLPELVEILEEHAGSEVRESEAAVEPAGEDSVSLMTIHAAKGLEFPLVALADLGDAGPTGAPELIYRSGLGLGIPLYDPEQGSRTLHPWSYRELRDRSREAEAQEENRLLYVAVTRAQEHLILSGWRKRGKAPARSWLAAILEGLGGEEILGKDPGILLRKGREDERAAGNLVSVMATHGREIQSGLPLPETPAMRDAAPLAEELLRRSVLPLPAPDGTPYLATVTEVVQHHLCPRRYHLRYLAAAPTPEHFHWSGAEEDDAEAKDDELPAEVLGERVHRLLAEEEDSPLLEQILEGLPAADRDAARRQAEAFRRSSLGREAASGEAMREFPFALERRGAILRGQIDLILRGRDGNLKVVDYKTSRIGAGEVEEKSSDYELQLRIYALAVREIFGRPPAAAVLHFLHPDVIRQVDITPEALRDAESAILRFFDARRGGSFPQNPDRHCFACGYREAYCPEVGRLIAPANR